MWHRLWQMYIFRLMFKKKDYSGGGKSWILFLFMHSFIHSFVRSVFLKGAFGFDRQSPPEGKNIITTTRSHSNRAVTEAVESCQPSEVVRVGGAGHKVQDQQHAFLCVNTNGTQSLLTQ